MGAFIMARMRQVRIAGINSDQRIKGLPNPICPLDRDTAAPLGVFGRTLTMRWATITASGQVSTTYKGLNQLSRRSRSRAEYQENPDGVKYIFVPSTLKQLVPTLVPLTIRALQQALP